MKCRSCGVDILDHNAFKLVACLRTLSEPDEEEKYQTENDLWVPWPGWGVKEDLTWIKHRREIGDKRWMEAMSRLILKLYEKEKC